MSFFIICENWQVLHTVGYSHFVCVLCSSICARACVCVSVCLWVWFFFVWLLFAVGCLREEEEGGFAFCEECALFCFVSHAEKGRSISELKRVCNCFPYFFHFQRRNKVVVVVVVFERCPVGSLIVGAHDDEWFGMNHFGSFVFVVVVIWCEWMFFFVCGCCLGDGDFLPRRKSVFVCVFFSLCIFFYYECSSFQIVSTMFLDSYCHQRNREKRFFFVCNSIVMFPNHWFCWLACHFFFVYVYFFFQCKRRKIVSFLLTFIYFFRFFFYIILKAITCVFFNLINLFLFLLNNMKTNFQLSIFHLDFFFR